jgi:hypothetical protein
LQRKRKAFLHFKNLRSSNSYDIYKGRRNYVNAKIRQIKRDFWDSYTKSMERDFYGLHRMGIPQGARESIMNSYKGLSTTIQYSGSQREVSLLRGVKQGDHNEPPVGTVRTDGGIRD